MKLKFKIKKASVFYVLAVVFLYLLFFLTRLWKLTILPRGLHIDEAAASYDAWCLAQYGVDRHLKSWPVYLINFGGGQSILYCYSLVLLFKIFGFSLSLIRVPAVLFSCLTLTFGMLLTRKLIPENPVYPLLTGALVVICPYFIMAGRFGLDCNLMCGMSTVFLYCFVRAVESNRYRWYFLAGISGGAVLYTYAIAYLALPLFLAFSLLYACRAKKFFWKKWLVMAVPMGILAFPLILEQLVNLFDWEEIRLGIFTVTKLYGYRAAEIGIPRWKTLLETLYSVFIGDGLNYNSLPGYLNLYCATIPLALIGAFHSLSNWAGAMKKREWYIGSYPFLWFLAMLITMSCTTDPNVNRVNGIFFVTAYLAVEGIYVLLTIGKYGKELKESRENRLFGWCRLLVIACLLLYGTGFCRFGERYYFGEECIEYAFFDVPVPREAIEFLEEHPEYKHNRTYMAEEAIWFACSALMSPYDLMLPQNDYLLLDYYYCGGLPFPEDGCNYLVRDIYPEYAQSLRDLGYEEIQYGEFSLFYQKE